MGADMIGYLVIGPNGPIGKGARRKAVSLLKKLTKAKEFGVSCANCGHKFAENDLEDGRCYDCATLIPDVELANSDPQGFVNLLAGQWPPDFRDVATRAMPGNPKQMIVFAGDMSWGDSPDGTGYLYLQELCGSGLAKVLGVL